MRLGPVSFPGHCPAGWECGYLLRNCLCVGSYPCEQHELTRAAILFWLNCKSVYSYWQNERKQLNAEVSKIECVTASGLVDIV